jgi:hypothetical protein
MLLLLMAASSALAEDEYNFLKQGYSFFDSVVGGTGGGIGLLEPEQVMNPPFEFDFDTYEVTWAVLNMEIIAFQEIGDLHQWSLVDGDIAIYEDESFNLDYGDSPSEGIPTATDGTPALVGYMIEATFIHNNAYETGSFSGMLMWTGGSRFDELGPLALHEWSIFDGSSTDDAVNVPDWYHSRFAGRIYTMGETPTRDSSWSQIRALY